MNISTTIRCAAGLQTINDASNETGASKASIYQAVARVKPLIDEYESKLAPYYPRMVSQKSESTLITYVTMRKGGATVNDAYEQAIKLHAAHCRAVIKELTIEVSAL